MKLVKLVGLFRRDEVLEKYGEWEILKSIEGGSPYISTNDVRCAVTEEELKDVIDIVNTLNEHPDIIKNCWRFAVRFKDKKHQSIYLDSKCFAQIQDIASSERKASTK